ncbi:MAG: hypothetical protein K0R57_5444 [Paenibacillaceae bacterium]|jgi:hypothetical protein|nr:hypothetical protein [Paenibacillaceae bacterium]
MDTDGYKIADHIKCEGYFSHDDDENNYMKQKIIDIFAGIFNEHGTYVDSKYEASYLPIKNEIKKMEYIIGFHPEIRAWEHSSTNTIFINIYILASLSILSTFRDLINILRSNDSIDLEIVMKYFTDEHLSKEGIREIDQILQKWRQYSVQKNRKGITLIWSSNLFDADGDFPYTLTTAKLIFHHEMAHWHLSKFNKETRDFFIGNARNELLVYIDSLRTSNEELYHMLKMYLSDDILVKWAEEIAADMMSFHSLFNRCATTAERRDVFISIGLFYSLMKMQELHFNKKTITLSDSHPPVLIRERAVRQIFAGSYEMTEEEFNFRMAGAWFFYSTYVDIIVDDYRRQ